MITISNFHCKNIYDQNGIFDSAEIYVLLSALPIYFPPTFVLLYFSKFLLFSQKWIIIFIFTLPNFFESDRWKELFELQKVIRCWTDFKFDPLIFRLLRFFELLIVLNTFLEILFYISVFSNLHNVIIKSFFSFWKASKRFKILWPHPTISHMAQLVKNLYSGHCLMWSWIMLSVE